MFTSVVKKQMTAAITILGVMMRQADPPVSYLVGTPKGRLSKLEQALLGLPWQSVRPGVEVKLLAKDDELYVLAQSRARIDKERGQCAAGN